MYPTVYTASLVLLARMPYWRGCLVGFSSQRSLPTPGPFVRNSSCRWLVKRHPILSPGPPPFRSGIPILPRWVSRCSRRVSGVPPVCHAVADPRVVVFSPFFVRYTIVFLLFFCFCCVFFSPSLVPLYKYRREVVIFTAHLQEMFLRFWRFYCICVSATPFHCEFTHFSNCSTSRIGTYFNFPSSLRFITLFGKFCNSVSAHVHVLCACACF